MSALTPEQVRQALASPRFAALARLKVPVSMLESYDSSLLRDARLLVPVDLRALLVRSAGSVRAVPTATTVPQSAPGAETPDVLPTPPAPFAAAFDRPAGVHLHWAMPDGLTRGDGGGARATAVSAGNPTALPPLPDRWVVVRMSHGSSTARSWVIESDRVAPRARRMDRARRAGPGRDGRRQRPARDRAIRAQHRGGRRPHLGGDV